MSGMTEEMMSGMTEKGMSGMTEERMSGMTEKGMSGRTEERMSGMTEGDVGHDGREGVPDFVGIAGFAVLPVLSCHACRVPLPACLSGGPSVMPAGVPSGGRLVKRCLRRSLIWGENVIVFHLTGYAAVKRRGGPRHVQAKQGFP